MKNFPDKLLYEDLTHETGKLRLKLTASFRYYVFDRKGTVIQAPKGFVTDLASVPRFFWRIVPPFGRYTRAAVIHDYLYSSGTTSRKFADDTFLEAMADLGVKGWKRWVMHRAVRTFGRGAFKNATLTVRA